MFRPLLGSGVFAADGEKDKLWILLSFIPPTFRYIHRRTLEVCLFILFFLSFVIYSIRIRDLDFIDL